MAAYRRVYDYACCHLQADCLESGISSGPYARLRVWDYGYLYLFTEHRIMFVCPAMKFKLQSSRVNRVYIVITITVQMYK